jgi:Kdo2-lipid IVA lauroyltransferase/acyltransferase
MNKISRKHHFEWLALKTIMATVCRGDITSTAKKIRRLVPLLELILPSEYGWAKRNIHLVYGEVLSPKERKMLVRMAFENVLLSHVEGMKVDEVWFQNEGTTHLHDALKLGRGAIACSVHLGSWEPALKQLAKIAAPTPTAIVYRHANNPKSETEFIKIRSTYGVEWIRRDQPRQILQAMKEKKVLGLMTDINTREGGVTAPFLGIQAQCPPGPARLSLKFGTPIVPMIPIRKSACQTHFLFLPPIIPEQKAVIKERDVVALTHRINAAFEPMVHRYAEQYNWLHSRWRGRKGGETWSLETPIEEMLCSRTDPLAPYPKLDERVLKLIQERL